MIVCFLSVLFGAADPDGSPPLHRRGTMLPVNVANVAMESIGGMLSAHENTNPNLHSVVISPPSNGDFILANPSLEAVCRGLNARNSDLMRRAKSAGLVKLSKGEDGTFQYELRWNILHNVGQAFENLANIPSQRTTIAWLGTILTALSALGTGYLSLSSNLSFLYADHTTVLGIIIFSAICSISAASEAVINAATLDRSLDNATKILTTCFQFSGDLLDGCIRCAPDANLPVGFVSLSKMQDSFFKSQVFPFANLIMFCQNNSLGEAISTHPGYKIHQNNVDALQGHLDTKYERWRRVNNLIFSIIGLAGIGAVIIDVLWYMYFINIHAINTPPTSIYLNSTFPPPPQVTTSSSEINEKTFSILNTLFPVYSCCVFLLRMFHWYVLAKISDNDTDSNMLDQSIKQFGGQNPALPISQGSQMPRQDSTFQAFQSPRPTPRPTNMRDRLGALEAVVAAGRRASFTSSSGAQPY